MLTKLFADAGGLVYVAAAIAGGVAVARLGLALAGRITRRTASIVDDTFLRHLTSPIEVLVPLLLVILVLPQAGLPPGQLPLLAHLAGITLIAVVAWCLISLAGAFRDAAFARYPLDAADNLKARAIHTQVNVLVKIAVVIVLVVAGGSILMTFEKVRQVGVSLLASAGIAGIIVGFAAQRSLATIFAGFQLALTQPIRIDDVVIVEGEWGWIEEITLTYVVVRVWDLRRLVVPITYFIERPFQNWTRVTADLLGTVYLYTDYTVPLEDLRAELRRVVEESGLWDGKVCGIQVTDSKERTLEVRALVSGADSGKVWNLRCLVRERLVSWLQRTHPGSLPRLRAEVGVATAAAAGAAAAGGDAP